MTTPDKITPLINFESTFDLCRNIPIDDIVETNFQGVQYISWARAWGRLKEHFPNAFFTIHEFGEDKLPYLKTEVGYFVRVTVHLLEGTVATETLPVMDNKMHSLMEPNARDINDTIKRCLVKAMALHGFGLSVYEGDDVYAQKEKFELSPGPQRSDRSSPERKAHTEYKIPVGLYRDKKITDLTQEELEGQKHWIETKTDQKGVLKTLLEETNVALKFFKHMEERDGK